MVLPATGLVFGVAGECEQVLALAGIQPERIRNRDQHTGRGPGLASSKITPFLWAAILLAWTVAYGARQKKKGESMAAAGEVPVTSQVRPPSPDITKATDRT